MTKEILFNDNLEVYQTKGDGPRKSLAISLHEIVGLGAWPI